MSESNFGVPEGAKRVFKGILFDIWQKEQEVYDGSFRTFEWAKRCDSVDVIAVVGDKIIIQEQEQPAKPRPFLSLPGGRADEGGSPLEEAKRELLEETGYVSEDWELWKQEQYSSLMVFSDFIFIARNCVKESEQKLDGGEKIKINLVSFEDFLMLSENPKFRTSWVLKEALFRMRLYPKIKEEFSGLLFKK